MKIETAWKQLAEALIDFDLAVDAEFDVQIMGGKVRTAAENKGRWLEMRTAIVRGVAARELKVEAGELAEAEAVQEIRELTSGLRKIIAGPPPAPPTRRRARR